MGLFTIFRNKPEKSTANLAKERLQIIVAHERSTRNGPDYLADMQRDILAVVRKYIDIDNDKINVSVDDSNECSILELNVALPE